MPGIIARDPPLRQQQRNVDRPRFGQQRPRQGVGERFIRRGPFGRERLLGGVTSDEQGAKRLLRRIEDQLAPEALAWREDRAASSGTCREEIEQHGKARPRRGEIEQPCGLRHQPVAARLHVFGEHLPLRIDPHGLRIGQYRLAGFRGCDGAPDLGIARRGAESADTRLRLLSLLSERLSDDDIAFLEAIVADDRAPKVKALATSLLARLGRGAGIGEDAAELAGFFSVKTKGILRRSRVIEAERPKTPAQWQRRKALLDGADLASFAGALGITPQELIAAWDWNVDPAADMALINLVVATGTDAQVADVAKAIGEHDATGLIVALAPRIAPTERARQAEAALNAHSIRFELAQTMAGPAARLNDPLSAPAGKALLAALQSDDAKPSDQVAELHALGLIASREGARRSLERLTAAGLLQGDPRLDMLRLNAALDDKGATP